MKKFVLNLRSLLTTVEGAKLMELAAGWLYNAAFLDSGRMLNFNNHV
jgi:hypothetical protein